MGRRSDGERRFRETRRGGKDLVVGVPLAGLQPDVQTQDRTPASHEVTHS